MIKPELRAEFEAEKKRWLPLGKCSSFELGLLKLECEGWRMIVLCSKCYFVEKETGKNKLSTKGMSKAHNAVTWGRFKAALCDEKDMASNRGLRMRDGQMMTYKQQTSDMCWRTGFTPTPSNLTSPRVR